VSLAVIPGLGLGFGFGLWRRAVTLVLMGAAFWAGVQVGEGRQAQACRAAGGTPAGPLCQGAVP
jgi:hypothetical protein